MKKFIKDIVPEEECEIIGWVEKIRQQKTMQFVVVKDRTGAIQVAIDKQGQSEIASVVDGLSRQSVVRFAGHAIKNEKVTLGGIEFVPCSIEVESVAEDLPLSEDSSRELKMDYRWIDLRNEKQRKIFEIRTFTEMAMREYLTQNGAIEIHSPKITSQSSEGGADVFTLDYYGEKAYLTQSPQFYKQMAIASGFEKVFEIGQIYRAEKSYTARHTAEAVCLDFEMARIDSHHDVMDAEEELFIYVLKRVKEKYGDEIKELFGKEVLIPEGRIPRLKLAEVFKIFKEVYGLNIPEAKQLDLDPEMEKLICEYAAEHLGSEAVFITDYPAEARAFYSKKIDGSLDCMSFDLLYRGWELSSGAVREHRYDELKSQIEDHGIDSSKMEGYLQFFKYGCPRHGGFGMGIDRILVKLLDLQSIKDSIFVFRGPNRIKP